MRRRWISYLGHICVWRDPSPITTYAAVAVVYRIGVVAGPVVALVMVLHRRRRLLELRRLLLLVVVVLGLV